MVLSGGFAPIYRGTPDRQTVKPGFRCSRERHVLAPRVNDNCCAAGRAGARLWVPRPRPACQRLLSMDFGFYLPCYWPDMRIHMRDMYRDVAVEAQFAEELGYVSFTIPEHHFTNALVHPNALLTAVRIASVTKRAPLITSTTVLPFHDVRILAGEIAQADCLTDGRIQIGAGSGAYQYEFERLQLPIADKRERFDDSLN